MFLKFVSIPLLLVLGKVLWPRLFRHLDKIVGVREISCVLFDGLIRVNYKYDFYMPYILHSLNVRLIY